MLPSVEQSNIARRQSLDLDPDVSIEVTSKDVLNLTLTQTCITLINELAHVSAEGHSCLFWHWFSKYCIAQNTLNP